MHCCFSTLEIIVMDLLYGTNVLLLPGILIKTVFFVQMVVVIVWKILV